MVSLAVGTCQEFHGVRSESAGVPYVRAVERTAPMPAAETARRSRRESVLTVNMGNTSRV